MLKYWSAGWKMTLWNPFLIGFFFLYQLAWGTFLYRFVRSIVVPLLHRYPGSEMPDELRFIFAAESQFQIMKTELVYPYLWTLAAVLIARMVLTPVLNAGIYDSIHQTHTDGKRSFVKGAKRWSLPFTALYLLQTLIMLAPLIWLVPYAQPGLAPLLSGEIEPRFAFVLILYLLYAAVIKLLFMYIQFGIVTRTGWLAALKFMIRRFPAIAALSASITGLYLFVAAAGITVSMIDAGLLAVLLHQVYHLVKVMFRLWEISTQHQYFMIKQPA